MLRLLPALCLTLPGFANAQPITTAEQETLSRIIQSQCVDIHETVGCETVVLLKSATQPDSADLIILPSLLNTESQIPLAVARSVAFNGGLFGMEPQVVPDEQEGFILTSEQIGVGRRPWTQSLTVVWHDDAFVVSEYSFSSYDRIRNHSYMCSINLLDGAFTSEVNLFDMETEEDTTTRISGETSPFRITLESWAVDWREPDVCRAEAEVYYNQ